ncbi:hypothetical protein SAMN06264849_102180 [Melghirimyces algeriensis]|uniref:Pyridoxal phosphate homeostasis protein n=2 Tax=Melghirimyces algeriensis TaxID=910412 RepID=A0A521BL32_9BACL|nr:YggS family pyridoxal phosphate-dependent enzyme [Melghirimyces algeriensis]SMO47785.1 hypothetical protein SAMN06264849_102180 [Melghirimyces algeriensis]
MDLISQRLQQIKGNIVAACQRSGRNPKEVQIVAVTKYVDMETTRRALDAGLVHIGESRAQEAVPKWKELGGRGVWHFIGHLQSNKAKAVAGRFTYVHSLDRYSLAKELSRRSVANGQATKCMIQVNISGEKSKHGLKPDELLEFARESAELPQLEIEGLMTMAPVTDDPEEVRPIFRHLKTLQQELQRLGDPKLSVPHLSMGMSRDYIIAVEEGATFVRLGSVLVGTQPQKA